MNKNIGIIVLVFAVGLLIGGLSQQFGNITGQVSKTTLTSISVTPNQVLPGDYITFNIAPGYKGTERYVYIYTIGDIGQLRVRRAVTQRFCAHTNTCKDPASVKYQIPIGFSPGKYAAVVKDAATGELVRAEFTVGYIAPKGHA